MSPTGARVVDITSPPHYLRTTMTVVTASFGLVPPSSETLARFDELATWTRTHANLALVPRPASTYKELAASLREGSTDLAWLPPVAYAWLAEGVTPIGSVVRDGKTTYAAALVVREGSPRRALSDLEGARAGWVDPWSAAGYVVPRLELARARVQLGAQRFYGSHRDALLALGRDECDVVGTHEQAWTLHDVRVRVLATFGAIPTDVIAARRNLGPREYEVAVRALRAACDDAHAKPLVHAVFGAEELRDGIDPGHEALRRAYERGVARGVFDETVSGP